MIRVFTLEVLLFFTITAFIIGGLIGIFLMCCFILGKQSDGEYDTEMPDENYDVMDK